MASAEAVLDKLTASNIFDLRGVIAVVTGGGTVSNSILLVSFDIRLKYAWVLS